MEATTVRRRTHPVERGVRVLGIFCGAFSGGVFLARYLLPMDWLPPCAVLCFLLALGRLAVPGLAGRRLLLLGTGLSLALGFCWLREASLPDVPDAEREVVMLVCDNPVSTPYGAQVDVKLEGFPGRAVWYGDPSLLDLRPGQRARCAVRLRAAERTRAEAVLPARGVFWLAYGQGAFSVEEGTAASPRWWPVRLGRALRGTLATLLDGDSAAFLSAILTGDRSGLSVQAEADLSEAGLSHVLAVSGMHCGFLLALAALLTGRAVAALPLLAFYAVLTGGSPSVLRACVMLSLWALAPLFRRESDGFTSLSFALFLILLKNPYAAASVSLQLSFAAMAGLLWVSPRVYRALAGPAEDAERHSSLLWKVRRFLAANFAASLGALALTAPLSAWYFGTLPLVSPLANLLCLWAVGGIFTLGLACAVLGFLSPSLGALLALVPDALVRYVLAAAHLLARLPGHAVYTDNPYLLPWMLCAALLFGLACCGTPALRKSLLAALLASLTLLAAVRTGAAQYRAPIDAVVLDVGQGQSVALASGGQYALVDCGGQLDAGFLASRRLRTMGCQRLDLLILTHYDTDHVNGVESLLSRMDVRELLVPEPPDDSGTETLAIAREYGVPVRILRNRERIPFGNGALTVFPPMGRAGGNDLGLSVLADAGETELLITGDMGQAAERTLLRTYALPDIEALVAGHHGSRTSTSNQLLDALTPETVCVSVGENTYGHPAPETLERLAAHGCQVLRTDLEGSIHLAMK